MISPRSHSSHLLVSQQRALDSARQHLQQQLQAEELDPSLFCISVTGSHARAESLGASRKMEVTLIHESMPIRTQAARSASPLSPFRNESVFATSQSDMRSPGTLVPFQNLNTEVELSNLFNGTPNDMRPNNSSGIPRAHSYSTPTIAARPSSSAEDIDPKMLETISKIQQVILRNPSFEIDICQVDTKSPFEYKNGNGDRRTIPTRALDSTYLIGNKELLDRYRVNAFAHLSRMNHRERRDFDRHFASRAYAALSECFNGVADKPVDIKTGKLLFDNAENMSTKYPLLRPVQYHLAKTLISKADCLSPNEAAISMPISTVEKIRWMRDRELFPTTVDVEPVCGAYDRALQWYEQSQSAYAASGASEISADPKLLAETVRTIHDFLQATPTSTVPPSPTIHHPKARRPEQQ